MKIPFDIKFRPQIESGEYKVETRDCRPVCITCWDAEAINPKEFKGIKILAYHTNSDTKLQFGYNENGKFRGSPDEDLFLVTPEPELTEFEHAFGLALVDAPEPEEKDEWYPYIKEKAAELLSLAREQFIKDGYVLETKAFHDAVEKVTPEVMKEVSENVDKTNEELTEFERELESFYNHHLQVCTYDNQGTVEDSLHDGASKLLAIARKELCDQIVDHTKKAYENGKAEALKDLPRWREWGNGAAGNSDGHPIALVSGAGGIRFVSALGVTGEKYIMLDDLKKLPGFKED